ncbi:MFS transporter [Actinomadura madurae]|uniref:MFS transporter n=1 Tax=Actinomadura madurae TaxID=1993 RepID=UPI00202749BD|nr:MFS transporter [Actinomadura madurae]MCP9954765.1 MFS transporter [Actinomadura madurae]MCP9971510.1 MFS transporter [Actinomadura madurae]MCP9983998.1 MFS transporter [Actinomadura madurae]MCQ0004436.1 MFS transporter [Actinomadura madurae]URN00249.1 MFS transporter [Actinomadura madurae]
MDPHTIQRRRWYILGVLTMSLLVVVLDNTILNVALKTIADPHKGLGATQSQLEWAINSYTLVFAGLLFTFGVIGDRLGRKRVLTGGMIVFAVASLVSAYAQTPEQLIYARALMGLGGAAVMPQTLSIITNVFEPHERARAIGIWAGAVGLGVAIGPLTGGLLLQHFWWGSVFLINVPVIAVGVVLMAFLVPESRNPEPGRLDPLGVALSVVGLVVLSYGIIQGGEKGNWLELPVLGPILAGLAVLALFAWHEARTASPAFDVKLFKDPRMSAAVASIALCFFAATGVFFFANFYMQSVRGLTPLQSGAMVLPFAVAQLAFAPRSAAMVRRFGAKAVCTTGLMLVTVALASYQFVGTHTSLWILGAIFFVQGAGMANVMPPATESVMSALPREKAGAGSAVNNVARQVAVAMGVAVLGSVVASVYRGDLRDRLAALPAGAREAAGESIEGAHAVAAQLGPAGQSLVGPADAAFVHAMHTASVAAAVVSFLGALVVLKWMPGRAAAPAAPAPEPEPESRPERAGV